MLLMMHQVKAKWKCVRESVKEFWPVRRDAQDSDKWRMSSDG